MPELLAANALDPRYAWLPVLLLIFVGVMFAVSNIALSVFLGPSRTGAVKESTYESGMVPIGDTRKRFNVRFYIVAITFLVFDVEIIFFYPWATLLPHMSVLSDEASRNTGLMLLVRMAIFITLLLVAYVYAWGKGVFRWD